MSGIGSVFSWKWVLILNGNLWSHNLIWLWALRILFKVYHFWICKHDNVDFISNVDSKAVDIWVRCAFNDVSYNYNMGPNLRKETGKEGSCRKVGRFPPKHDDCYFFDFGLTLFLTQISMTSPWYEHFSNSFQSYHQWWSINLSLVNKNFPRSQFYLRFFTLLFFTVAPHSPHYHNHWLLTNVSLSFPVNVWR